MKVRAERRRCSRQQSRDFPAAHGEDRGGAATLQPVKTPRTDKLVMKGYSPRKDTSGKMRVEDRQRGAFIDWPQPLFPIAWGGRGQGVRYKEVKLSLGKRRGQGKGVVFIFFVSQTYFK